MDAFISYSSRDKVIAHATKKALNGAGFSAFLAHDDLQVSEEWRDAIIDELKVSSVFVVLLSASFKTSDWCAQEIGFIVSRPEVLVIPLSLDGTVPYGFIGKLQSKRVRSEDDIPELLRDVLLKKRPRLAIPHWITKVKNAGSFRGAEAIMKPLVPYFHVFTTDEINTFLDAAMANGQVWDAGDCKTDYLPRFARMHWAKTSKKHRKDLLKKIQITKAEMKVLEEITEA